MSTPRGYIALISTLILCAVLTGLAFETSTAAYFARYDSLDSERSAISLSRADSCVETTLLSLALDPTRAVATPVVVHLSDSSTCTIVSLTHTGTTYTLIASAYAGSVLRRVEVRGDIVVGRTAPVTVTSWKSSGLYLP